MWATKETLKIFIVVVVVQLLSCANSATLWMAACQAFLSCLPEFEQTLVCWVGDAIQQSYPLLPPSLITLNLSYLQGLFQWISSLHQVAKVLELQLQHQSFQWIFRLISFRLDWFDLFAVQGTLKSLLQHPSSKASILRCSAFFTVQPCYFLITGFLVSYLVSLGLEVLYLATQHYYDERSRVQIMEVPRMWQTHKVSSYYSDHVVWSSAQVFTIPMSLTGP